MCRSLIQFERAASEEAESRASARHVRFLYVPERRYLAVDGERAPPGSDAFQYAIGSLYAVAYALHFILKARGTSAPIGHLHGLFWVNQPGPMASMASPMPRVPARRRRCPGAS
jgi:hypothetical protein